MYRSELEFVRKRQWKLPEAYGKSAEIGGEATRPKKQIIAQTSNTEPRVRTSTVVLKYYWASTAMYW
jgi:hypothetical protein